MIGAGNLAEKIETLETLVDQFNDDIKITLTMSSDSLNRHTSYQLGAYEMSQFNAGRYDFNIIANYMIARLREANVQ